MKNIHPTCQEMIQKLNDKVTPTFSEVAKLRTFGKDKFSMMKKEDLKEVLSLEDIEYFVQHTQHEEEQISAMRWTARGLSPSLALFKIKVDKEINLNRKMSKQEVPET